MTIRVGISGWTYAPWRGVFFPPGLAHRRELGYASRRLPTIEINGTFYSTQTPETYARWAAETPADFVFSVKGPRFITHLRRLRDCRKPLANFFASGVLRLGRKLGPVLWQLPPNFRYDRGRLEAFLAELPRTTGAAARLARLHEPWLRGRTWARPPEDLPLRHALEVRHGSFENGEFTALLRREGVALVAADTAGRWPFFEERTSDFAYARLHGDRELYASGYTLPALRRWAARVRSWSRGARDVFVYFDNDVKVRAPFDARTLASLLARPARRSASRSARPSPRIRRRSAAPRLPPRSRSAARARPTA